MPEWLLVIIVILAIVLVLGLPVLIFLKFNDKFNQKAEDRLDDILSDYEYSEDLQPGYVEIFFATYYGLIVYTNQTDHQLNVRLEDAGELVGRLHKYNMRYCWLAYGMIYIPILSYLNLLGEHRKIRKAKSEYAMWNK